MIWEFMQPERHRLSPAFRQVMARFRLAGLSNFGLNRIEAQFRALRHFALDGTGHASQREQGGMIGRYIIWRSNHAYDERLRQVVTRANVA